ncbi:MAG: glycosyl transferase group 1 [Proteobacteria bacterium]|nr:glycosyl transferase group 1 [Pseudomonadota bacterium]
MKIVVYGINFAPELTGIGKYTGEMADWLAAQGHEVRVVTAPPYYPAWKVDAPYSAYRYKVQDGPLGLKGASLQGSSKPCSAEGAALQPRSGDLEAAKPRLATYKVWRCPLWVPGKVSGAKRLVHLASFALTSLPVMLRQVFWRPDVVWMAAPALMCAPGAWLTARLSGAKAVIHIQDYEVDAAFQLGLLKSPLARRFALWCERTLLRGFDVVSTISGRMVELAKDKGVAAEKVVFFPNWVDLAAITPGDLSEGQRLRDVDVAPTNARVASGYRVELGIPVDAVVALYSGNMGMKQGLEVLPAAAALCAEQASLKMQDASCKEGMRAFGAVDSTCNLKLDTCYSGLPPPVFFVFCGQGAGKAVLDAACEGLANVRLLPLQPFERLGELLTMADIHLLPQRADAADLVMPSKLTGMLASARPVVATAQPGTELADVVANCGLVVEPENPQAVAEAVLWLAGDAELRARLGAAGRAYAEQYLDREVVLGRYWAMIRPED